MFFTFSSLFFSFLDHHYVVYFYTVRSQYSLHRADESVNAAVILCFETYDFEVFIIFNLFEKDFFIGIVLFILNNFCEQNHGENRSE